MKNSEIALVILVAIVSVVASYFICNAIMGDANELVEKISYVKTVDTAISEPSTNDFNTYMTNPTVDVYIGDCDKKTQVFNEATRTCVNKDDIVSGGDEDKDKDKEKNKPDED